MKTEFKWALLFSLATIVWLTMEFLLGFHTRYIAYHPYFTNLFLIPSVFLIRAGMKEKKRRLGNSITYQEAMKSGLLMTFFIALLSPIDQLIFHNLINPGFFKAMIEYAVTNHKATRAQAENYFNFKSYVIDSCVGSLFLGFVIVAVNALVLRSKESGANS